MDVPGREAQHSGVGVDRFLSLDRPAAELAGAVIDAPGHPDAYSVGGALAFPVHHRLQVVHVPDDPDELLRLHEVEGDGAGDVLALGDDALGDVPDDRGLYETGLDAVPVQVLLESVYIH